LVLIRVFIIFCISISLAHASGELHQVVNSSIGMINVSLTENESTLEENAAVTATQDSSDDGTSTADTGAQAATVSSTSFALNYEFSQTLKRSYFMDVIVPLVGTAGTGVFLGSVGVNFYMNGLSTLFSYKDAGTELTMRPTMRYYWGASTGIGYIVYTTDTAKKSDIYFDLGVHGGVLYNITKKYAMRLNVGVGRGTGVAANSFGVKFFLGMSYPLGK
jgi:hypothetical protein